DLVLLDALRRHRMELRDGVGVRPSDEPWRSRQPDRREPCEHDPMRYRWTLHDSPPFCYGRSSWSWLVALGRRSGNQRRGSTSAHAGGQGGDGGVDLGADGHAADANGGGGGGGGGGANASVFGGSGARGADGYLVVIPT